MDILETIAASDLQTTNEGNEGMLLKKVKVISCP